jgi:hypothetical protein
MRMGMEIEKHTHCLSSEGESIFDWFCGGVFDYRGNYVELCQTARFRSL